MLPLAALIREARVMEILRSTLASRMVVCYCETETELRLVMHRHSLASVVIDLGERAFDPAEVVATIRTRFRSLPVLGLVRWPFDVRHILPATRAGLTDIVVLGHENAWDSIQRVLKGSHEVTSAIAVLDVLAPCLSAESCSLVAHALRLAKSRATVEQLAFSAGLSPKTLQRRVARYGLGSPSELLAWCRIFLGAQLLDSGSTTIASVARELRFPSPSAFRRTLRALTDIRPSGLKALGGLQYLVQRFAETARGASLCRDVDRASVVSGRLHHVVHNTR
jgi:AraC-like DNA-binding protein